MDLVKNECVFADFLEKHGERGHGALEQTLTEITQCDINLIEGVNGVDYEQYGEALVRTIKAEISKNNAFPEPKMSDRIHFAVLNNIVFSELDDED